MRASEEEAIRALALKRLGILPSELVKPELESFTSSSEAPGLKPRPPAKPHATRAVDAAPRRGRMRASPPPVSSTSAPPPLVRIAKMPPHAARHHQRQRAKDKRAALAAAPAGLNRSLSLLQLSASSINLSGSRSGDDLAQSSSPQPQPQSGPTAPPQPAQPTAPPSAAELEAAQRVLASVQRQARSDAVETARKANERAVQLKATARFVRSHGRAGVFALDPQHEAELLGSLRAEAAEEAGQPDSGERLRRSRAPWRAPLLALLEALAKCKGKAPARSKVLDAFIAEGHAKHSAAAAGNATLDFGPNVDLETARELILTRDASGRSLLFTRAEQNQAKRAKREYHVRLAEEHRKQRAQELKARIAAAARRAEERQAAIARARAQDAADAARAIEAKQRRAAKYRAKAERILARRRERVVSKEEREATRLRELESKRAAERQAAQARAKRREAERQDRLAADAAAKEAQRRQREAAKAQAAQEAAKAAKDAAARARLDQLERELVAAERQACVERARRAQEWRAEEMRARLAADEAKRAALLASARAARVTDDPAVVLAADTVAAAAAAPPTRPRPPSGPPPLLARRPARRIPPHPSIFRLTQPSEHGSGPPSPTGTPPPALVSMFKPTNTRVVFVVTDSETGVESPADLTTAADDPDRAILVLDLPRYPPDRVPGISQPAAPSPPPAANHHSLHSLGKVDEADLIDELQFPISDAALSTVAASSH
ncbi:uncharacterized protein AMSG_06753 [Thecamonas trahens ATCC 50062]|uniref:Uncharacterized protein n=1 Tax=Thecamonas trahens ATCC 50062 TaxID=461836 RepID=A0A0L0DHS1_THETB|nr:hypothetical protein AMSG_06753 [Thecamonas trahens ATCC 50062]KNC50848.1 hypothetical protein AMSG_06753 [Thecamonas trahens ATCC 50062]|eukprot:XP_013756801.1 hypothetical protein AMSG_06753 [Thecamonas trahens ATCC 50062]